jgi:hypothetical protein
MGKYPGYRNGICTFLRSLKILSTVEKGNIIAFSFDENEKQDIKTNFSLSVN